MNSPAVTPLGLSFSMSGFSKVRPAAWPPLSWIVSWCSVSLSRGHRTGFGSPPGGGAGGVGGEVGLDLDRVGHGDAVGEDVVERGDAVDGPRRQRADELLDGVERDGRP
jgi:hypothetical protein